MNSPSILILERDGGLRETFRIVFEASGYDVVLANTVTEALERLFSAAWLPSKILINVSSPHSENWKLVEMLRCSPLWKDIPLTLMSTSADCPDTRARCRASAGSGARLLPMPFEFEEVA